METNDFVYYRDKKDGKIKSMGYEINSLLPYLNMPVMRGGGKLPGKKQSGNLTIPVGLALLNDAIIEKEKRANVFNSYISQDDGVKMLPEELHKKFFEEDNSKTNKRNTRKYKRENSRKTRKNKRN